MTESPHLVFAKLVPVLLVALVALVVIQPLSSSANAATSPQQPLVFSWAMKERFGKIGADGLTDYHWTGEKEEYEDAYVHPHNWTVDFDACTNVPSQSELKWEIDGQPLTETSCSFSHDFPELKTYAVKLSATVLGEEPRTFEELVTLKDFFIVSIGDSFASGEGNPDKPGWHGARWVDARCHRSAAAAPAKAALVIEKADPHSAVTFISFACSGAGIWDGLLKEQSGKSRQPQLDRVFETAGPRTIDALLISIGGNDVNFGKLVLKAIQLRHAETDFGTKKLFQDGFDALPGAFASLEERITRKTNRAMVANIFITEYPDLVRDETRDFCDHSVPIVDLLHGISEAESHWALDSVITPLNALINQQATAFGWKYVDNILNRFGDDPDHVAHGFCADDKRWVNTFTDSWRRQGDQKGTVHPNLDGHFWCASRLVEEMRAKGIGSPSTP